MVSRKAQKPSYHQLFQLLQLYGIFGLHEALELTYLTRLHKRRPKHLLKTCVESLLLANH